MKQALSFFLLLISIHCTAQHVAVSADKMNVVYTGVPNPLTIVADDGPCSSLVVTTDHGRLEKVDHCKYILNATPEMNGHRATITISRKQGNALRTIGQSEFRIKGIPLPSARIAARNEGSIPLNILRNQLGISAMLDGFDFDYHCVVTDFKLTLIGQAGNCTTLTCHGPYFSDQVKELFQKARSGDQLVIFQIKADTPGQKGVSLLPFELMID